MAAAGLAEEATEAFYSDDTGGPAVPCRCYVDRGMQAAGEQGPVAGARVVVGILRADVSAPQPGGVIELIKAGVVVERLVLEAPDATSDESMSRWVVVDG